MKIRAAKATMIPITIFLFRGVVVMSYPLPASNFRTLLREVGMATEGN